MRSSLLKQRLKPSQPVSATALYRIANWDSDDEIYAEVLETYLTQSLRMLKLGSRNKTKKEKKLLGVHKKHSKAVTYKA